MNKIFLNRLLILSFILLLPTQFGKHFFLPFSYLSGVRIDYLALTLYVTDVLALLILIFNWKTLIVLLKNRYFLIFFGPDLIKPFS